MRRFIDIIRQVFEAADFAALRLHVPSVAPYGYHGKAYFPVQAIPGTEIAIDVASGKRVAQASSSRFPILTPDGKTIATCQEDGSTQLRVLPEPR